MNISSSRRAVTAVAVIVVVAGFGLTAGTACASTAGWRATSSAITKRAGAIDGVYRLTWTEQELVAAGASRPYAHVNLGSAHGAPVAVTMTLRRGQLLLHWPTPPDCRGSYATSGGTVTIRQLRHCHGVVSAAWSLANERLRLTVTRATDAGDRVLFGGKSWKKIG